MKVESLEIIIKRLKDANKPLTVDKQRNLGEWLEKFISLHDERLLGDVFLRIEENEKQVSFIEGSDVKTYDHKGNELSQLESAGVQSQMF